MCDLTHRQIEVLRFITSSLVGSGYPPTIREIGRALSIASENGVSDHLNALERKGMLTRIPRTARGLKLTDAGRRAVAAEQGGLP